MSECYTDKKSARDQKGQKETGVKPMNRKCVVRGKDWHINIPADYLEENEGIVRAYLQGHLVGVFDLGVVDVLYLSGGSHE